MNEKFSQNGALDEPLITTAYFTMKTNSKDFGAVKNSITGKTIREMTWAEILALPAERLSQDEAMRRMKSARAEHVKGKSL